MLEKQLSFFENEKDENKTVSAEILPQGKILRVISLFSGCGGMDLGFKGDFSIFGKHFEKNPYEILFSNDIIQRACDTYKHNFNHESCCCDIRELDYSLLPEADIVIGGFPCQDFSLAAELYDRLHPCGSLENRINCLKTIHELGYETGSGFMIGLPGQSLETVADDLLLLKSIHCKMAGIGPFISNPKTKLAGAKNGDAELTRRAVAIARILLPDANLPVTTALTILSSKSGEAERYDENPFSFGANVVMKKVTPDEYKRAYEIYPAAYSKTDIKKDRQELEKLIENCGRRPL